MLSIDDLEQRVTDLLLKAIELIQGDHFAASMLHCRMAMEEILHQIHFEVHGERRTEYASNSKWMYSFKEYLGNEKGKWTEWKLFHAVNIDCNKWLHATPGDENSADEHDVNLVISHLCSIMRGLYSIELEIEPIESPLLKAFDEQLSNLSRTPSNLTESARDFLDSLPEGPKKEGWKSYFESNPKAEMLPPDESRFVTSVLLNWLGMVAELYPGEGEFTIGYLYPDEIEEMKRSGEWREEDPHEVCPMNLKIAFMLSGRPHLFADEFLSICNNEVNPQATWWDIERSSSPEEISSEISEWFMSWLNMRLVPEGEGDEVVQLFPRLNRLTPEDFDFEELRRLGTFAILKEAFSNRGLDEMRPLQLTSSLAVLGCDIEWGIASRKSPAEDQLEGIPENCMKWLDFKVIKHPDGDEVLLSLKEEKDKSEVE